MIVKGKKIPSREGREFNALLLIAPSDRSELGQEIAAAIEKSPLKTTGLQCVFYLHATSELFVPISLYSTGNTTEEQVGELLRSVPDVLDVRDLSKKKAKWSEAYHPEEYEIDLPNPLFDVDIPPDLEFGGDVSISSDFEFEDDFPNPNPFIIDDNIDDFAAPPPPSKEHLLCIKRYRNAKAVWEFHQTAGYLRDISRKPMNPRTHK